MIKDDTNVSSLTERGERKILCRVSRFRSSDYLGIRDRVECELSRTQEGRYDSNLWDRIARFFGDLKNDRQLCQQKQRKVVFSQLT